MFFPGHVFPVYWFDVIFSENIPIFLEDVKCHTGYEASIQECSYPECITHRCIRADEVVVECSGIKC